MIVWIAVKHYCHIFFSKNVMIDRDDGAVMDEIIKANEFQGTSHFIYNGRAVSLLSIN